MTSRSSWWITTPRTSRWVEHVAAAAGSGEWEPELRRLTAWKRSWPSVSRRELSADFPDGRSGEQPAAEVRHRVRGTDLSRTVGSFAMGLLEVVDPAVPPARSAWADSRLWFAQVLLNFSRKLERAYEADGSDPYISIYDRYNPQVTLDFQGPVGFSWGGVHFGPPDRGGGGRGRAGPFHLGYVRRPGRADRRRQLRRGGM